MAAPVFEEFDPASACDCLACVHWRRVLPPQSMVGPHPAAHRVRNAGRNVTTGAPDPPAPASPARPSSPASHGVPGYPGRAMFRPGADNEYVTQLGRQLAKEGFGRFYASGPGPRWGEADRRGIEAFQRAQGWRGGAADGYPGPETWRRLFS